MNVPTVAGQKEALRQRMRAKLRQLAPGERAEAGAALVEAIQRLPQWESASVVLLFAPLPDEPDVWPLVWSALRAGKMAALPRREPGGASYEAARVDDPERDTAPGAFGIREPLSRCPPVPLKRLDFILAPGVAFDRRFYRLGRGKGFYDRLLAGLPGFTCGTGFDFQLVEALPGEPHDVALDCIAIPSRALIR